VLYEKDVTYKGVNYPGVQAKIVYQVIHVGLISEARIIKVFCEC